MSGHVLAYGQVRFGLGAEIFQKSQKMKKFETKSDIQLSQNPLIKEWSTIGLY